MSMRVILQSASRSDDYMVSFARDGRVYRQRDDKTIGYAKKENGRWIFRRPSDCRIFTGKTRSDAVQEWVDCFNKKKIACANCNVILPIEQMKVVWGLHRCPAHTGEEFKGITIY